MRDLIFFTRLRLFQGILTCLGIIAISRKAYAEIRNGSLQSEIQSVASPKDRILWNLRPGVAGRWEPGLPWSSELSLGLEGRVRYDTQSEFVASQTKWDTRLDRASLQWQGSSAGVVVGWQKYTWGDSAFFDGVDVINPRDLTEPLYTDDELLKIAIPSVNFNDLANNTVFQVVVVGKPERTPVREEINGVPFETPAARKWFSQMEIALKAGGLLKSGWDINGYIASHYERIPQAVLIPSEKGVMLRLVEPRVFTLGLTATQSVADVVLRAEIATHLNRALPDIPSSVERYSDQLMAHATADFTLLSDLVLTGELWAEHWSSADTATFKNTSLLLGGRAQKPFWSGRVQPSAALLFAPDGMESWFTASVQVSAFEGWQFNLEAYWAQTSTGRVLARRQLKDLLRSALKYQF